MRAPPAIISIFLGDQLNDIIEQLAATGGAKSSKQGGLFETGVSVLPKLPREAGDRNRTSPFAFTGNKFEFRAVGSSQNVAGPNTILNTMVAESLDYIATEIESAMTSGKDLNSALQTLLPLILKESKKVIFNGNGYSEEWHAEAARRGLPNHKNTVDVLPVLVRKDTIELFTKYKVYSENELKSRFKIQSEAYVKTITIEGKTALLMARTQILPAGLRYQRELAETVVASKAAGLNGAGAAEFNELVGAIGLLTAAISKLEKALSHHPEGTLYDHAVVARDTIVPALTTIREAADKLETLVADDLWPLPTYREMLFIR